MAACADHGNVRACGYWRHQLDVLEPNKNGWRNLRPAILTCNRGIYAVNELPQPQLRSAFGFWKTNPCRISVSSYSRVVPFKYKKLLGSTKIRAPNSSKILSRSRDCVSNRI